MMCIKSQVQALLLMGPKPQQMAWKVFPTMSRLNIKKEVMPHYAWWLNEEEGEGKNEET